MSSDHYRTSSEVYACPSITSERREYAGLAAGTSMRRVELCEFLSFSLYTERGPCKDVTGFGLHSMSLRTKDREANSAIKKYISFAL